MLRPSNKMIVPARLRSLVLGSFVFHLVAPALVYGDYSSSERYLKPLDLCRPIGSRARSLVPGGAHSKSACVAKTPQVFDVGLPRWRAWQKVLPSAGLMDLPPLLVLEEMGL